MRQEKETKRAEKETARWRCSFPAKLWEPTCLHIAFN